MSAGDANGDGRLDLVIATPNALPIHPNTLSDSGGISLLLQDAALPGRFLASQWLATGGMAEDGATANLDGDGLADLVVADGVSINGRALLLPQNLAAPGTFLGPASLLTGSGRGSSDVAVADLNGDGRTDIILAAHDQVAVFYQYALGGFNPAVMLAAGLRVQGVAVSDLDGDGCADLVVANVGDAPAGVSSAWPASMPDRSQAALSPSAT
jgi:hypothetical protein